MKQLQDRVAIVTGASSGIGKAIAENFAAEGAKTVLVARRKEVLDGIVAEIRGKGGAAEAAAADVTKEADVDALFAKVVKAHGRVDIVVNNAGVAAGKPNANMTSVFLMGRAAVKQMKAQTPQGGRIINMGSVSAKTPRPNSIAYTATKFAVQGMTHQLTMDGRKYGVVSSVIHPGATLSAFSQRRGRTKAGWGPNPDDDYIMAAEDVARVALLMASLPPEVNLYEGTILPNTMRSLIGRG
jgi:NADP-dependent 3-hydroxy acid dehydrogenase YdfG